MNSLVLGMLAETAIHPGAGQSTGVVDLPVARESATHYPVIVGSSLKGALRDFVRQILQDKGKEEAVFGEQENAGNLIVSDARLLLLPVRSLTGHYKWLTCPYLLERYGRDAKRSGHHGPELGVTPAQGTVLAAPGKGRLFLEEREFTIQDVIASDLIESIAPLVAHAETAKRLQNQVAILTNDDFAWFARYGLPINARNQLSDKKTSQNLWYEETVPPDSLFYTNLFERDTESLQVVRDCFEKRPYLQAGGNETVGQGWFAIKTLNGKG